MPLKYLPGVIAAFLFLVGGCLLGPAAASILERGNDLLNIGGYTTRLPPSHPEGYLEGFAQLYSDAADLILAQDAGDTEKVAASLLPGIADGLDGMRFINGAIASHKAGTWLAREDWA